jgi:hypothetical protein
MNFTHALYPSAPIGLKVEADFVTAWLRDQGPSEEDCHLLIGCFTPTYLLLLPKPKRNFRMGNFTVVKRSRHLWYQKAASLLGWVEQRQFLEEIRFILNKVYADSVGNVEFTHAAAICPCLSSQVEACRGNDGVGGPLLTRIVESVQGGGSREPPRLLGRCGRHDEALRTKTEVSWEGVKGQEATKQGGGINSTEEKRKLPCEERWREGMPGPNHSHPAVEILEGKFFELHM